jgi:hypothetical protein
MMIVTFMNQYIHSHTVDMLFSAGSREAPEALQ